MPCQNVLLGNYNIKFSVIFTSKIVGKKNSPIKGRDVRNMDITEYNSELVVAKFDTKEGKCWIFKR